MQVTEIERTVLQKAEIKASVYRLLGETVIPAVSINYVVQTVQTAATRVMETSASHDSGGEALMGQQVMNGGSDAIKRDW